MRDKIRVLIADDHPLVRVGICTTLEETNDIEVIGEAIHGSEILPLCIKLFPDVLLLDLSMPALEPRSMVSTVRTRLPQSKIVILSAHNTLPYVRNMINANVNGYVLKDDALEVVAQAIRSVMCGGIWYSQAVVKHIIDIKRSESSQTDALLAAREQQILDLVVNGLNNVQIAIELDLAEQTVKNYLSNIYRALNVSSRSEAILWAINHATDVN